MILFYKCVKTGPEKKIAKHHFPPLFGPFEFLVTRRFPVSRAQKWEIETQVGALYRSKQRWVRFFQLRNKGVMRTINGKSTTRWTMDETSQILNCRITFHAAWLWTRPLPDKLRVKWPLGRIAYLMHLESYIKTKALLKLYDSVV